MVRSTVAAFAVVAAVSGCTTGSGDLLASAADEPEIEATPVSIRGERYCEVLAISPTPEGLTAEVYATFPLNDCPDDLWQSLDAATLPEQTGTPIALLNGPRYWMIDQVTRTTTDDIVRQEFGGLAMNRYATVSVPDFAAAGERYVVREVNRRAVMTIAAGQQTYVLVDPDGATYVMQSFSQQVDPNLTERDLPALGGRLELPAGWRYDTTVLTEDLVIEFGDNPARVVQDEFHNSYSQANL